MSKFDDLFKKYNCDDLSEEAVKQDIERILAKNFASNNNVEVYKQCLNLIDLTSLSGTDTHAEIKSMVEKVNDFKSSFPQLPNVAAICVYRDWETDRKSTRLNSSHITRSRMPSSA